jgi:hypothetical protein
VLVWTTTQQREHGEDLAPGSLCGAGCHLCFCSGLLQVMNLEFELMETRHFCDLLFELFRHVRKLNFSVM